MIQGFTGWKLICGIGILPMIPRFTGSPQRVRPVADWKPVPHSREGGDQERLRRIDDVRKDDWPGFIGNVTKLSREWRRLRDSCQEMARFIHRERSLKVRGLQR